MTISLQPWEASKPTSYWMPTVTFPGRFESLAKISEFVIEAAKKAGLDESAVYAVDLAVDEACTNIIEHAYGGENKGEIQCTCQANKQGLTVILKDQGKPFNPERIHNPEKRAHLKDLKSGGAGLFLIRKMMDEVHFEFTTKDGNVLTMVKLKNPE